MRADNDVGLGGKKEHFRNVFIQMIFLFLFWKAKKERIKEYILQLCHLVTFLLS